MLNKTIYVLENKLLELRSYPYKDIHDYVESLEFAIMTLKQASQKEEDLDDMYREYLSKL